MLSSGPVQMHASTVIVVVGNLVSTEIWIWRETADPLILTYWAAVHLQVDSSSSDAVMTTFRPAQFINYRLSHEIRNAVFHMYSGTAFILELLKKADVCFTNYALKTHLGFDINTEFLMQLDWPDQIATKAS